MLVRLLLHLMMALLLHRSANLTSAFDSDGADVAQVEVVKGFNASLPCAILSPPRDSPVLTLWYFDDKEAPIYSYDQRFGRSPGTWSDVTQIGNRVTYMAQEYPPVLVIFNVTESDARTYRCRVDYQISNSRVAMTKLTVVVPPSNIHLNIIKDPVKEGQSNDVICTGSGGLPPPRVVWLQDGNIVDSNFSIMGKESSNSLDIAAHRKDINSVFTCKASNNDVTPPLETSFLRNVTVGALRVTISHEDEPLVANKVARFQCTVVGSNPKPIVLWYRGDAQMESNIARIQSSSNVTISSLSIRITRRDHGTKLTCRAENPLLPLATLEEIHTLNVAYKPIVKLIPGRSLDTSNLREGNDAFFQCTIDANPDPYKVTWLHEGTELKQNVSAGVILSRRTVALQSMDRMRSGSYQCKASNVEGDTVSNSVNISIKYTPRCAVIPVLRGVTLFELTKIKCEVDADPPNVTFSWTFNNSARKDASEPVSVKKYRVDGLKSILEYTPRSERDYGTLLCFATNDVGTQDTPCSFTVISAGSPEPVSDCQIRNVSSHSAGVKCVSGFNGGLPQRFLMQIYQSNSGRLVVNMTDAMPVFLAHPLETGVAYRALVMAFNSKGTSEPVELEFTTQREIAMHKTGLPSTVEPNPLILVLGVCGGILLVVVALLLAVWWIRMRNQAFHTSSKTVTNIVHKENNPDLLSMDTADDSDEGEVTLHTLESSTNLGATIEREVMTDGEQQEATLYSPFHRQNLPDYSIEPGDYVRYSTMSPSIQYRAVGADPIRESMATFPRGRRYSKEGYDNLSTGGSIGGIVGGSLFRGSGKSSDVIGGASSSRELEQKRQTTVRLLRSGSPESSC